MNDVVRVANTSATASLLWSACRPEPALEAVRAAVDAGADLERAANAALLQRASPLLWRALESSTVEIPDAQWSRDLREDALRCRAQAQLLLPRFARAAIPPLVKAGLEPLVVKGAALAERYPEPGLRPMVDVDIVLPAAQHDAAVAALTAIGWEHVRGPGPTDHSSGLVHAGLPGLPLELHASLGTWRDRGCGPTSEELWRRRRPARYFGVDAFGLGPEDELGMLIAHAGKPDHRFGRILWMADLVVVAASRAIDWDRVAANAERGGYRTAVAIALTQAARLGLDAPAALRAPVARGVRGRALEPLFADDWPLTGKAGREDLLRYVLVDRSSRRIALFVGDATRDGIVRAPGRLVAASRRAYGRWKRMRSLGSEGFDGTRQP
jgi:hypothetical protein